jgi:hypothetical protein
MKDLISKWTAAFLLVSLLAACAPPAAEIRLTTVVGSENHPANTALPAAVDIHPTYTVEIHPTNTQAPSPTATSVPQVTSAPSGTKAPDGTNGPAGFPTPAPSGSASLPSASTRLPPREWAAWPVVPTVSARALEIYRQGLANGNDPKAFSVVGDCQSEPNVFMGVYDSDRYALGSGFEYLQETIDHYQGSFGRKSASVRDGLSAPSALSPLWSDPAQCQPTENPVACELRVRKPAILFINLGTNWKPGASADLYGDYLRQIVKLVVQNGTLPILSTKADNVEGDYSLNAMTTQVAYEFDIPLWNFWLAADSLPGHGLDSARSNGSTYLTPEGWARKSFTGLQALDAVRRAVSGLPPQNP